MKKIKIISIGILTSFIVLLGQENPSLGKMPDIDLNLLDFWATWCKPCKQVMKHLNQYHNEFNSEGFQVLMINQDTPRSLGKVKAYVNSKGYDFLVGIDPNQQISKKLNGQIMPNLILINQDATVRWRHQGYMPGEELEIKDQIQSLLSFKK